VSGDLLAWFDRSVTWLAGRCQHCVRLGVETASRRDHRLRVADKGLLRLRCIACLALSCAISSVRDDTVIGELVRWTEPHSSVLLRLSFTARGTCFLLVPHCVRAPDECVLGMSALRASCLSTHIVRPLPSARTAERDVQLATPAGHHVLLSVQTASSCGKSVLRRPARSL